MTRIDGLNPLSTSRTLSGHAPGTVDGADKESQASSQAMGRQDTLAVSERGRIVAVAAQAVHQSQDVRAEKVAALKAAIAGGSYSSNAREIAERLLANGGFGVD